jgi:hypothetical protein
MDKSPAAEFTWTIPAAPPVVAPKPPQTLSASELAQRSIDYWVAGNEESELRFSADRAVREYAQAHDIELTGTMFIDASDLVREWAARYC